MFYMFSLIFKHKTCKEVDILNTCLITFFFVLYLENVTCLMFKLLIDCFHKKENIKNQIKF